MTDSPDQPTLYEGLVTTRAIRRYRSDDIPEDDLAKLLFAATRGPSGHNQQPFRFLVVRRGPETRPVREVLTRGFQAAWAPNRTDPPPGDDSRPARMARTMSHFVDHIGDAPVIVFACIDHNIGGDGLPAGASVFPGCQNLLLAARALGYGGVMSNWHRLVTDELGELLGLPDHVSIAATIPLGRPVGRQGPVRRRPLPELVFENRWGESAAWAQDPPGTRFTGGG